VPKRYPWCRHAPRSMVRRALNRRCLRYSALQDLSSALHDESNQLNLLNQKNRPHEKIVGRFFHWTAKFDCMAAQRLCLPRMQ